MPHWWRSFRSKKRPIVKCKRRGVLYFFNAYNVSHFVWLNTRPTTTYKIDVAEVVINQSSIGKILARFGYKLEI
jgi:hypothetical protein